MLKKIKLGQEAINYMKSCLTGAKTLSSYLLDFPLEKGSIVSFLPESVNFESVNQFHYGGILRSAETDKIISQFITNYLSKPNSYAVFEDAVAEPTYRYLSVGEKQFFTFQTEVYHYVCSEDSDVNKKVMNMLRVASSYVTIGVLAQFSSELNISQKQELLEKDIKNLALNSQYILVGAYDGEGMLIWHR